MLIYCDYDTVCKHILYYLVLSICLCVNLVMRVPGVLEPSCVEKCLCEYSHDYR